MFDALKGLLKRGAQDAGNQVVTADAPSAHNEKFEYLQSEYNYMHDNGNVDQITTHDLLRRAYRAGNMRFLYMDRDGKNKHDFATVYVFYSPLLCDSIRISKVGTGVCRVQIGRGPVVAFSVRSLAGKRAAKILDNCFEQQRQAESVALEAQRQQQAAMRAAQSRELQATMARVRGINNGKGIR